MIFNETTLTLLYTLVIGLVIFYIIFFYRNWRYIEFAWKQNGFFVPILPLVGQAYVGLFSGKKINALSFMQWYQKYIGSPTCFWLGQSFSYATSDANEAKIILTHPKCFNKAAIYDNLKFLFGGSLILAPYEIWRPHRKHFLRSFKPNVLKTYSLSAYKQSTIIVDELKSIVKPTDIFEYFTKYSFTNFFLGNLRLDEDKLFPDMGRFGAIFSEVQPFLASLVLNPMVSFHVWCKWFSDGRAFVKLHEEGYTYSKIMIKERREQHPDVQEYINNNEEATLMDLMLTDNNRILSDNEVFEELNIFAVGATDTTACTLAFSFTLLGMHPEVQDNVYNEVIDVVGENEIMYEHLSKLIYTKAVILECLRLFPPLPLIGRMCEEDIDIGTKVIPKGASCLIDIYHVHRDAMNWPEPLKFDPTRFLPENKDNIKPNSFLGFSAGQRDCIGKDQAMVLLRTTIANIVRNFTITSNHKSIDEFCLESYLTMKATNNLDCQFMYRPK